MKIETQKQLESLLKLCQKHGVRQIEIDGIKMQLEAFDAPSTPDKASDTGISQDKPYTDDDFLFWSSQSHAAPEES